MAGRDGGVAPGPLRPPRAALLRREPVDAVRPRRRRERARRAGRPAEPQPARSAPGAARRGRARGRAVHRPAAAAGPTAPCTVPTAPRTGMLRRAALLPDRPGSGRRSVRPRPHQSTTSSSSSTTRTGRADPDPIPIGVRQDSVEVRDSDGRATPAGSCSRSVRGDARRTRLPVPNRHRSSASSRSDNWIGWDLRIVDSPATRSPPSPGTGLGLDLSRIPAARRLRRPDQPATARAAAHAGRRLRAQPRGRRAAQRTGALTSARLARGGLPGGGLLGRSLLGGRLLRGGLLGRRLLGRGLLRGRLLGAGLLRRGLPGRLRRPRPRGRRRSPSRSRRAPSWPRRPSAGAPRAGRPPRRRSWSRSGCA